MPNRLSDLVPDEPSGSDHALLKAALTLYETWPIKTDEELEKLVLKILVRVFKDLHLADRIDEVFSDDFLNLSQAIIKTILEENEFC
jgi:tRNA A22 N-methylase